MSPRQNEDPASPSSQHNGFLIIQADLTVVVVRLLLFVHPYGPLSTQKTSHERSPTFCSPRWSPLRLYDRSSSYAQETHSGKWIDALDSFMFCDTLEFESSLCGTEMQARNRLPMPPFDFSVVNATSYLTSCSMVCVFFSLHDRTFTSTISKRLGCRTRPLILSSPVWRSAVLLSWASPSMHFRTIKTFRFRQNTRKRWSATGGKRKRRLWPRLCQDWAASTRTPRDLEPPSGQSNPRQLARCAPISGLLRLRNDKPVVFFVKVQHYAACQHSYFRFICQVKYSMVIHGVIVLIVILWLRHERSPKLKLSTVFLFSSILPCTGFMYRSSCAVCEPYSPKYSS